MGSRVRRAVGTSEATGAATPAGWTENAASERSLVPWSELRRARGLILMFALRDLRVRYKQAAFGVAWVVVQPVLTVLAFTAVFDRLVDVPSGGLPYPVFALAGLLGLEPAGLHRLAGYLPAVDARPVVAAWHEVHARMSELSRPELRLLIERAWEELRSRDESPDDQEQVAG